MKLFNRLSVLLSAIIVAANCRQSETVARVSVNELEKILGQDGYVVLDTRELGLFAAGHVPTAISVPFDEVRQWARRFPADTKVILYCD